MLFLLFHPTLNNLGLLRERGFACQTLDLCLRNTSWEIHVPKPFIWFRENMNLFPPHNLSPVIFRSVSLNQPVVGFCGCVRETVWISLSLREGGRSGFSWPWAQRRGLVFPAVSDCSRQAECKHTLMCGAALDTADTAQAISTGPQGLRFGPTDCPFVLFFTPLNSHPLSLLQAVWNWYFSSYSVCHKYGKPALDRWKVTASKWKLSASKHTVH